MSRLQRGEIDIGAVASIIVLGLLVWGAVALFNSFKPDKWTGFYELGGRIMVSQEYDNPDDCRYWINELRGKENFIPIGRYNFECGSNCRSPETLDGPYRCDETFDE